MPASQSRAAEGAWVAAGDSFLVSRDARQEWSSLGPVLPLILGVYDRLGHESLRVLRNRIFTNVPLKNFDRAAIRVAAKSCSFVDVAPPIVESDCYIDVCPTLLLNTEPDLTAIDHGRVLNSEEAMQLARSLAAQIPRQEEKYLSSRSVAAVLIDSKGKLLGTAVNTNRTNKARHAEVNLLLNWWVQERRPVPAGSVIYVTLSPCQMCAELIGLMAVDAVRMPVVAAELDPGRHGRHNILMNLSVQPPAGR